jgi:hypothetical protein
LVTKIVPVYLKEKREYLKDIPSLFFNPSV